MFPGLKPIFTPKYISCKSLNKRRWNIPRQKKNCHNLNQNFFPSFNSHHTYFKKTSKHHLPVLLPLPLTGKQLVAGQVQVPLEEGERTFTGSLRPQASLVLGKFGVMFLYAFFQQPQLPVGSSGLLRGKRV